VIFGSSLKKQTSPKPVNKEIDICESVQLAENSIVLSDNFKDDIFLLESDNKNQSNKETLTFD